MGNKGDSSVKKYFCDRCGGETDAEPFVIISGLQGGDKERHDLCGECFNKFYAFITNEQDDGEGDGE